MRWDKVAYNTTIHKRTVNKNTGRKHKKAGVTKIGGKCSLVTQVHSSKQYVEGKNDNPIFHLKSYLFPIVITYLQS